MPRLGVNIDHVATLRQARGTRYPDPVAAAALAEQAGADQITVHLREDRRHIQDYDVRTLRKTISTVLNLELACHDAIVALATEVRPDTATLVPERRQELTTEGGLNVVKEQKALRKNIARLREASIRVSLFIDPDRVQIEAAHALEVDLIELHTGAYCAAPTAAAAATELQRLQEATNMARAAGMSVAAGHGLHYENLRAVVRSIPAIEEYNIGHSLVARAVFVGIERAVREMKQLLQPNLEAGGL
ncbi:MAG: pyridoxine 5'-phosphate synthase [Deltaproteobacteria bacterium]|nr:pyridoxine 5'-phosphate synthase [Deltaproteobacteria bacterium]